MLNAYGQIYAILRVNMSSGQIDVKFRANKSREQKCQTFHCQPKGTNIEDEFQIEQLRMKAKLIFAQLKANTINPK